MITSLWHRPATIESNNFIYKSLSCWAYNIAVGCEHACRFCYVPEASTNRMKPVLEKKGVKDPDAEWGEYVFLRQWDSKAFEKSLRDADQTDPKTLNKDGNRAVMLCTTTDPYQSGKLASHTSHPSYWSSMTDAERFQTQRRGLVRSALERILVESALNVRILTRSPLAREDFHIMKSLGTRLLFGMSIPTLNNRLAKIYEPKAPAPSQRLETLRRAKDAGLHIYVAVAPVYPECDAADMEATLRAVMALDPVTIFMEPINIRAENVKRIEDHAKSLGISVGPPGSPGSAGVPPADITLNTAVFSRPDIWRSYAVNQLAMFEAIALNLGIASEVLHLWPDKSFGSKVSLEQFGPTSHNWAGEIPFTTWLQKHWTKISQWPK